jgi:hypothetical protein
MSDSEFVASIVAGDPEGIAAAYDKYAGDLYGYCQSLLQDPNDAADAVTVSGLVSLGTQLTVEPGGHVVTVVLGLG